MNAGQITLRCLGCGNTRPYERSADPNLPATVAWIESNLCDQCDDGGGFSEEHWFDADGDPLCINCASQQEGPVSAECTCGQRA